MNKFYLTTAIPYVNAKPHLGHALEFIEGDVVARSRRAQGDDVFFVSGADENSLKNVQAAEREGISAQELCDRNTKAFIELAEKLNISFDRFMRSSSTEHFASSQDLWQRCAAAGDIYKKAYRGLYCVGCEMFYTRDELTETGECFEHPGQKLEEVEEENYFFRLSKYQEKLEDLIASDAYRIVPETRKNEALQFIRRGLEDFSVSRSKARSRGWGVPVPGDPEQIMYVWFDALNVYRSAAPERWPADLHVIGKGILRFHAVYWPAILLSASLPLPKELFVHGYVTVDGQKMSKSVGNVVDPTELVTRYGADAVRYYFLREVPPYDDGDYSEKKFKERYNADLANGLGNFAARVLALGVKEGMMTADALEKEIEEKLIEADRLVKEHIARFNFSEALEALSGLIRYGDGYADRKAPWKSTDGKARAFTIFNLAWLLSHAARLLLPFLPEAAQKVSEGIVTMGGSSILKIGDVEVTSQIATRKVATLFPRIP